MRIGFDTLFAAFQQAKDTAFDENHNSSQIIR